VSLSVLSWFDNPEARSAFVSACAGSPSWRATSASATRSNRSNVPGDCAGGTSPPLLAGGRDTPVCLCPPRCGAPMRPPRGVVCPPVVGACPVCCPPLRWVLASCAGAPLRCCGPNRDHCYDRQEARRIRSLAPWRHQGNGHPHAYGSCVRRAGTAHAVIHSPQQAFSQQSSGAAASRSRSHSSATNMVAAPVMLP